MGCDTAIGNLDATPSVSSEPLCVTCAGAGGNTDEDMWCDPIDNCPLDANSGQANADGDAAGDACKTCNADPAKTSPGVRGCGTADTDSDSDSDLTADCNDGCVSDPGKSAAGQCGCGVADTDSDLTADYNDGCASDPGKTAAGQCGCEGADTDSDTIANCIDACPLDPLNDIDADLVCGDVDNCPTVPNPDQADVDMKRPTSRLAMPSLVACAAGRTSCAT